MRFGQNVLRMTWNERFVQFSWNAHCFPVLERIWGQCDDFDNFDALKCDFAKTCCAWPETRVLYNFYKKRTLFPFWRAFQASVTILTTLTLTNAIWPKRAAYDLKRAFCTIFIKRAPFPRFGENLRPVWRFWQLWRLKMRFGQNVLRMTWKARFVQFLWKAHCYPVLKTIPGQCDDFDNFDAQKCDWAKTCCVSPETSVLYNFHKKPTLSPFWREWPAHDLKRAFCTIFIKSAFFSRFDELFRPVWRFWQLWRSQMQFGQNVLRMTWNERFVQFSWKAHCFPVFKRIWDKSNDFKKFDPEKHDLGKTSCAWVETSVLYNFHKKRTLFAFGRAFQASVTILTTLTLTNAIKPKPAAHDLKRAFCTIFIKNALFPRFGENLRPVWRFWQLWRPKMRFGQNLLRITWNERFVQCLWIAHSFPVLDRIWGQCDDFRTFDA